MKINANGDLEGEAYIDHIEQPTVDTYFGGDVFNRSNLYCSNAITADTATTYIQEPITFDQNGMYIKDSAGHTVSLNDAGISWTPGKVLSVMASRLKWGRVPLKRRDLTLVY